MAALPWLHQDGPAVEAEANVDCVTGKTMKQCDAECPAGQSEPSTVKGHEVRVPRVGHVSEQRGDLPLMNDSYSCRKMLSDSPLIVNPEMDFGTKNFENIPGDCFFLLLFDPPNFENSPGHSLFELLLGRTAEHSRAPAIFIH